jgi:hypothetical protein
MMISVRAEWPMNSAMVRVSPVAGWRTQEVKLRLEKLDANVQDLARQKQRCGQAESAKYSDRFERLDIKPGFGIVRKSLCDSCQAGAPGKASFGGHCGLPF